MILEDCGWGSCLEVLGGAASCSRGSTNLDRQDRMHIKGLMCLEAKFSKISIIFSHANNCIFIFKLFYAV